MLRDNPDMAARTRFGDPLIANYHLRLGTDDVALRALQRMVFDRNGNDTADFLFLPVNDASASDPDRRGTHWSLLLVDRRERARPIAYHYDSMANTNSAIAAELAERLGAHLQPARIPRQQNFFDCGVFVVAGTRALVGRLAQGDRPEHEPLHLDNLVADRQALQDRLSAHPHLG
ncbi:Ulp1 family isopeptidase [Bradyrhizobium sp. NAS96.2]|uniref:Ulp1 family isopeptidase n=1 Tax=Bradyrhizobium sp. NAS96.2 TaxID=1680160 RepID=UPI001FD9D521|nr:Ulp1 family isopeptidase [Bradyrhizobium sp. NAS96.2]